MLITLYARAMVSASSHPILADSWAEDVVSRIDYDFGSLHVGGLRAGLVAIRAKQLDLWTTGFLMQCPDATVLHLGCGLDSRVFRVDPPEGVRWFDVDYPEVIDMRRRLYPQRSGCQMIPASLEELGWLEGIPCDRSTFVVAEGVTMYLTPDVMRTLLHRLVEGFPSGQMAFDVLNSGLVRGLARSGTTVGETGASFGWGIDRPEEVEELEPGLELMADVRAPELAGFSQMPWPDRFLAHAMDTVPALQRMRCLLFRF
jgi:O-methyltransferase involved in polyketide biosynthesis